MTIVSNRYEGENMSVLSNILWHLMPDDKKLARLKSLGLSIGGGGARFLMDTILALNHI